MELTGCPNSIQGVSGVSIRATSGQWHIGTCLILVMIDNVVRILLDGAKWIPSAGIRQASASEFSPVRALP